MLTPGDVLILREREYRHGEGTIVVEIIAADDLRYDDEGYRLPVKCGQITWRAPPVVRFIEIRSASIPYARSRTPA
ncbi:hypothetical protein GCM10010123_41420 [Pilimelia anulata]|uniref:Uncharacterized protein n=1 Tax=Pilimelia anulata TaxID=53371 RepID=A0A8J3FG01_9ACTN|nr:hypothetical protein [Pilimelia anulata]GGK07292.1 hypothetical protein GCM10010123_41420 [Pilimelia anulata]